MTMGAKHYAAIWLSIVVAIVITLSFWLSVPFIYSAIGIAGLVCVGHLVTIDDDYPRGWSNPEEKQNVWRGSLSALALKALAFLLLAVAAVVFPSLRALGG